MLDRLMPIEISRGIYHSMLLDKAKVTFALAQLIEVILSTKKSSSVEIR